MSLSKTQSFVFTKIRNGVYEQYFNRWKRLMKWPKTMHKFNLRQQCAMQTYIQCIPNSRTFVNTYKTIRDQGDDLHTWGVVKFRIRSPLNNQCLKILFLTNYGLFKPNLYKIWKRISLLCAWGLLFTSLYHVLECTLHFNIMNHFHNVQKKHSTSCNDCSTYILDRPFY